jgi:hypothetical protein
MTTHQDITLIALGGLDLPTRDLHIAAYHEPGHAVASTVLSGRTRAFASGKTRRAEMIKALHRAGHRLADDGPPRT